MLIPRLGLCLPLLLAAQVSAQPIAEELTPERAVEIALAWRAEVAAAGFAIEAARGLTQQAGYRPNPTLSIQTENWRAWGDPRFHPGDDLDLFVFASQTFETGGKKRSRVAVAEADTAAAEAERSLLEWRLRTAVLRAWWTARAAAARRELLDSAAETTRRLTEYQRNRLEQGAAPEADLIKTQAEAARAETLVDTARIEEEQALLALAAELAAAQADFALADRRPAPTPPLDSQQLVAKAFDSRMELSLERLAGERAVAEVALRDTVASPNVTPYFGYKRTNGINTLVGGASFPLPVRNRNQGAVSAARSEVSRRKALQRALQARIRNQVFAAEAALSRRAELLKSIESGLSSRAAETYEIAVAAYREEAVDLIYLLDALRARNEAALVRLQALYDYQFARLDLEAAVGAPLAALGGVQ